MTQQNAVKVPVSPGAVRRCPLNTNCVLAQKRGKREIRALWVDERKGSVLCAVSCMSAATGAAISQEQRHCLGHRFAYWIFRTSAIIKTKLKPHTLYILNSRMYHFCT